MDAFIKKTKPSTSTSKPLAQKNTSENRSNANQPNFLANASTIMQNRQKDVGLDLIGETKGNLTNVLKLFDLAKERENIKPEVTQLSYANNFPVKEYKLIEINNQILEDFEKGQRLVFRGLPDDSVVLCTENKTYSVKEVEVSNTLMLLPENNIDEQSRSSPESSLRYSEIVGSVHHFLELKEVECVSSHRLREMLRERELPWNWMNETDESNTYSRDDLLDVIQMSEGELDAKLAAMPVILHKGRIRWLSYELRDTLLSELVDLLDDDTCELSLERIVPSVLREHLSSNANEEIISWLLRSQCTPQEDGSFSIVNLSLLRARASYLLRNAVRFDIPTFERLLTQLLPTGVEIEYTAFQGISVFEKTNSGEKAIAYLNVEDLPEDGRERLKMLFERKSAWTVPDITPFLGDLCANAKAVSAFLVAHCRSTKNDADEKEFCALKPV